MIIKLKGKTQKGKNRVHEWGILWEVFAKDDKVIFSQKDGPWVSIVPIDIPKENLKSPSMGFRWIHLNDDDDFVVEIVED